MEQNEFFDFAHLLKTVLVCRKKNVSGEPFLWPLVQWLQYKETGVVHYKNSLSDTEDFKVLSFLRRGKLHNLKNYPLQQRYRSSLPISVDKKNDLCALLRFVPPVFHEFYKNLPTSETAIDNDPDLIEQVEEEDI